MLRYEKKYIKVKESEVHICPFNSFFLSSIDTSLEIESPNMGPFSFYFKEQNHTLGATLWKRKLGENEIVWTEKKRKEKRKNEDKNNIDLIMFWEEKEMCLWKASCVGERQIPHAHKLHLIKGVTPCSSNVSRELHKVRLWTLWL